MYGSLQLLAGKSLAYKQVNRDLKKFGKGRVKLSESTSGISIVVVLYGTVGYLLLRQELLYLSCSQNLVDVMQTRI